METQQNQLTQMADWRAKLDAMAAQQASIVQAGHWTSEPADLLSIIGRDRWETFHCRILAWLMNPSAPHGLGPRFLHAFLKSLQPVVDVPPLSVLSLARPQVEVVRPKSRADLVIRVEGLTLVVEAKVDALEHERQCDSLYGDWKASPCVVFVFLTPEGRKPDTASGGAKNDFRCSSFRALRRMLTEELAVAEQDPRPGLATAQSYLATLNKEFA